MLNTINMYGKEEYLKSFDKAVTNVIDAFYDAEGAIMVKAQNNNSFNTKY